ncbi:MAG: hypothetical protein IT581_21750, partial [Verrucomicrobiales bacterium]|nr:hypothetical protein [Verrucomicrobiales bacterium]
MRRSLSNHAGVGRRVFLWLIVTLVATVVPGAFAHQTSDSYLRLRVADGAMTGQWFLALHDLEFAVGLDGNEDGVITWGELKARREAVLKYAVERLTIEQSGRSIPVRYAAELQVDHLNNGGYAV